MIKEPNTAAVKKVSDLGYLSDTMGGNKKLIKEIIDLFLKQAPEELSKLTNAVEKKDYASIKNFSHTMKSSVSIMGITAVDSILKEMEDLAKNQTNVEKIELLNNSLASICKQALAEIEEEKLNFI